MIHQVPILSCGKIEKQTNYEEQNSLQLQPGVRFTDSLTTRHKSHNKQCCGFGGEQDFFLLTHRNTNNIIFWTLLYSTYSSYQTFLLLYFVSARIDQNPPGSQPKELKVFFIITICKIQKDMVLICIQHNLKEFNYMCKSKFFWREQINKFLECMPYKVH